MIKVRVDTAAMEAALKRYTVAVGKTAEDSIIEMGRMGATSLASRIAPFGTASKSRDILQKAIYKDTNKAYKTEAAVFMQIRSKSPKLALAYASAIKRGDTVAAARYARKALSGFHGTGADGGAHLQTIRGPKGRVKEPNFLVVKPDELEKLKTKESASAGMAKAGFLQANEHLGGKTRIPKWLKKTASLGTSRILRNGWQTVVTIINNVRYASNVSPKSEQDRAIYTAYQNQLKRLKKAIAALGLTP